MTIIVGVSCPEGIALAADSRASILSADKFRIATDHARKLFAIGVDAASSLPSPCVVATFGWGLLNGSTIAGHMEDLTGEMLAKPPKTPADVAGAVGAFFQQRMTAHTAATGEAPAAGEHPLGFVVAGYDGGQPHLISVYLPGPVVTDISPSTLAWFGETRAVSRMIHGCDPAIDRTSWSDDQKTQVARAEYIVSTDRFALQDAIDFAAFAVRLTIETQRFTDGTEGSPGDSPTCGGAVNIAVVRPRRGVSWVQHSGLHGDPVRVRAEGAPDEVR